MPHIGQGGLGPLRLGQPLPKSLRNAKTLGNKYRTSIYADAQPLEGFEFQELGALAVVQGGPYARWGYAHPDQPVPASIKRQAVKAAVAGKLRVRMLVVTSPLVTTEKGLHAGQTWGEVRAALPGAKVAMLPGLWEEPSCIVQDGAIALFFQGCVPQKGLAAGLADDSRVLRIVVQHSK